MNEVDFVEVVESIRWSSFKKAKHVTSSNIAVNK